MTELPLTFLTLPAAGDPTVRGLQRKVRLLALRELLSLDPTRVEAPWRGPLLRVQGWLTGVLKQDGAALAREVGRPEVLAPLLSMTSGARPAQDMLARAVPALLAALQAAGVARESLLWDRPVGEVQRGGQLARVQARGMVVGPDGCWLRLDDGRDHRLDDLATLPARVAISGAPVELALHDPNPLSMDEAHPDKAGNALDLGGRTPEAWTAALGEALALVADALPHWHAELADSLSALVPVGYEPERHLSASYREAPGLAWLTLHPSTLTLAEAIVHETQHSKLNLLSWLDPVLHNAHTTWTASPVRPDLRPIMGVLLAVHAFVPVAAMHLRLAEGDHPLAQGPDFARRRAEVLASNRRGLDVLLEKAEPTALGRRLVDDLARLQGLCEREAECRSS